MKTLQDSICESLVFEAKILENPFDLFANLIKDGEIQNQKDLEKVILKDKLFNDFMINHFGVDFKESEWDLIEYIEFNENLTILSFSLFKPNDPLQLNPNNKKPMSLMTVKYNTKFDTLDIKIKRPKYIDKYQIQEFFGYEYDKRVFRKMGFKYRGSDGYTPDYIDYSKQY